MRQPRRNSCRPFGTSDAPSTPTTGSRPWRHLVVPPGLNHIPKNHVDYVLPMFSLIKILHGVAQRGSTSQMPVWVQESGDVEPVGVRINSYSSTWGAPQNGDPRLCCETRSGLMHTIFPVSWGAAPGFHMMPRCSKALRIRYPW